MTDDSAVQMWLEDPTIMREIEYVQRYFRLPTDQALLAGAFVLGVHILEALNTYGADTEPEPEEDENPELFPDPNDEDEPWKR